MPAVNEKLLKGLSSRQRSLIDDPEIAGVGGAILKSRMPLSPDRVYEIPVESIKDNPFQFRTTKSLDAGNLESLAASILKDGLRTPLQLRKVGEDLVLVAGWRRLTAVRRYAKSMKTVKATIDTKMTDSEHHRLTIIENEQRQDLTRLEKAKAYKALMAQDGLSQVEIAQLLGRSKTHVHRALKLANLPKQLESVIAEAYEKELSDGDIDELLAGYETRGSGREALAWLKSCILAVATGELNKYDLRDQNRAAKSEAPPEKQGKNGKPKSRKPIKKWEIEGGDWKRFHVTTRNRVVLEFNLPEDYEYNDSASVVRYIKNKLLKGAFKK